MKRWAIDKRALRELSFAGILTLCFAFLLWPGLANNLVPGFRDTYHFYYPQLAWLDAQAQQGNFFPAWNPLDGIGISTRGQGTSSLYYPLRLIYLLPVSLPSRLAVFILAHLLIAALGIRFAAERLGLSTSSGWLAASSFSLSCPVFFQHSNLIYLASAAWIGFAFSGIHRIMRSARSRGDTLCGTALVGLATTMMVLAGDPHTAVNSFIVAAACALATALPRWQTSKRDSIQQFVRSSSKIACAAGLCCVLTIIQWVPLLRAASSSRAGSKPAASHRVYDFSLSPWHTITCLFPTLGGNFSPSNSRAFETISAEGRMWIPSLYFGCIPLFGLLLRRSQPGRGLQRPLLFLAGFSLLAAFGSYSVIWLLREVFRAADLGSLAASLPRDPTASVYWLLTQAVPGYEMFRYPAKWTVWFAAAASLYAGVAWDPVLAEGSQAAPLRRAYTTTLFSLSGIVTVCGLAGIVAASFNWPGVEDTNAWLARRHSDPWLGHATVSSVARTVAFSAAVPVGCLALVQVLSLRQQTTMIVLSAIAELTFVCMQWITFVPPPQQRVMLPASSNPSVVETFVWVDTAEANIIRDLSFSRNAASNSATTAATMCLYQDTLLLGKIANTSKLRCLSSSLTLTPKPLARITGHFSRLDNLTRTQPRLDAALAEVGVTHRLTRLVENGRVVYEWHAVESAKPLCSLVRQADAQVISWKWEHCDELAIDVKAIQDDLLIVRQYNDGGWNVATSQPNSQQTKTLEAETTELGFLQLQLPAGAWNVLLTRKPLW